MAALQKQLFSLIFLHSSKHQYLPSSFLVRGQATTHEFPRNSETCLQKCIACKWLCLPELPILQPTFHSSRCYSSFGSVCTLLGWLSVGPYVWPVEKRLAIPPWTCIYHFSIQKYFMKHVLLCIQSLKHISAHIHTSMTSARNLHVALMLPT